MQNTFDLLMRNEDKVHQNTPKQKYYYCSFMPCSKYRGVMSDVFV